MAEDAKPGQRPAEASVVAPTAPGRAEPPSGGPPTIPDAEPVPGTMQLPRGAALPPPPRLSGEPPAAASMPTVVPAPLLATVTPNTAAPMPAVAPPAMPQDWRYAIQSEIARGGMGRVVEATDTVLGRTVALKEALSADPEAVRRFQRETKITARLEHPAIVPVHDAGFSPNGSPFYVMRKVSGRPLEELVARADTLNARLALVPQVVAAAHAIAHAHARGIVHRDIKPSNILVGDLGETIVIDWGLAKAIDEAEDTAPDAPTQRVIEPDETLKTRAGIVFGTPGFMAPEQLRGSPVDERCDVYALGATLYHLLARRPPHHAKAAEDMMKAAVAGPPRPLAELAVGVPPELATIVDKALAHDATTRYQDARALAEDLQRFLTGQLVASHYYTPRERLIRFLRKHRAVVGVSAAATLALAVTALVLVAQIIDERDRADDQARIALREQRRAEQAREKALRNARELVLANARHAATADPTRAAALVKPLIATELWREARDVGAAARAHGVAFSLPASEQTLSLELSRDGQRALAAGNDGIVRIYDLARRESRVIADTRGAVLARFSDGERKIVLFQGNRLTIVDAETGAQREITAPTAIARLEVSGPIAYWVDPQYAVWKLDLAGGPPAQVPVGEPIKMVAPSPDGRWIALGGTRHLLLVDRSSPGLPPENITEGETKGLTWAADSSHLIALIDDDVRDVIMQPVPQIFHRIYVGERFSVAYSAGRIFSTGPTGVGQVFKDGTKIRVPGNEHTLGVHEGRDRVVVAAKPQGAVMVLSDWGDHTLASPVPLASVATSARGPWIVAAGDGRLLVWNLDAIEPRLITQRQPSSARFVTGDTLIATYAYEPAEWIDLRAHKATPIGELGAIASVAASPDGAQAVVIDANRRAHLVAGLGQPQLLDGEISAAAFLDDVRLVLGREDGLRLEDQHRKTQLVLVARRPAARRIVATPEHGAWVAAVFEDGLVWRKHLASAAATELQLAAELDAPLAIAPDGTVVLGAGGEVHAWRTDGEVDVIARDLRRVIALRIVDDRRALAIADDTAYVIDLRPGSVGAAMTVTRGASAAADGSLIAWPTAVGGVAVGDPQSGWHWPLASPVKGQQPFTFVEVAPDGSRVMAMTGTALLAWTIELPRSAEATSRWLGRLTNAVADSPTGPLGWE